MKKHDPRKQSASDVGEEKSNTVGTLPLVDVLLATFNGERFLREQIDSILSQDYEELRILARDDGSNDGTQAILSEYANRFPGRFYIAPTDTPTGSAKRNFLELMKTSTADYVCFSDQDDVWLPGKVSKTMQAMIRLESRWGAAAPLLVFTDLRVVDNTLRTIHESFWEHGGTRPECIRSLAAVLGHNVVTGCTALINRRMLDLSLLMPEEATMHDAWIALLAATFGAAEVVRTKTVLYRQHDRNAVGVEARGRSPRDLIIRFLRGEDRALQWKLNERQAEALLRVHWKELPATKRQLIDAYLRCGRSESRFVRVSTMIRYRFFRPGFLRNMATIIDLLRGKMGQQTT